MRHIRYCVDRHFGRRCLNICAFCATEDERGKLFSDKIVLIIGQILLLVRECAHPPRPLVNVALGIEAIKALPGRPSREENRQILWEVRSKPRVQRISNPCQCAALSSALV
jgi:hypothetical protein